MANQTLTLGTPSARINFDSTTLSGLNNGETITINGGHLLIDGDVRWGNNAAVVDNIGISATLGGSIRIDATQVWEVPFSTSTGNVPARAVAGSNPISGSGITGELQAVWANGSLTPTNAGAVMPATGWVKLRSKTGNFTNGLVVTLPGGATITCSGAGKRSWIHVVGEEQGTISVPRLGGFVTRGDWYELGITSGADDQTFQYPIAEHCPAIQIETAPGSGEYEWWLNAGNRWGTATQFVSMDARGKFFGMVDATGTITVARRATQACGLKPPAGCRVRIANILLSNSTSTNWALNTIPSNPATRYEFSTSAAGVIDIQNATCNWGMNLTNAFRISIKDVAAGTFSCNNVADTVTVESMAIGLYNALELTPFSVSNCFTSVTLKKVRSARYGSTGTNQTAITLTDIANLDYEDCQTEIFGALTTVARGNTACNPLSMTRLVGTNTVKRATVIGGRVYGVACANLTITDTRYADLHIGETLIANTLYALDITTGCLNVKIEGFSNFAGLPNVHPKRGILNASQGSSNIQVLNIGTPTDPYNGGTGAVPMDNIIVSSVVVGLQIRRVYGFNTTLQPLSIANTVQNVVVDNVWGDANDAQALLGINMVARGCKWIHNTTGQSSVYGRHWEDSFISDTEGQLLIACNEPLEATAAQAVLTGDESAGFTSTGNVSMGVLGDNTVWTMPYYAIGHTGFGQTDLRPPFDIRGNNIQKHSFEYQTDTGGGFSAWKRLATVIRRNGNGNVGTNFFDADATGPMPNAGDRIQTIFSKLPFGTTIVSVVGVRVTVSNNFTATLASGETVYAWSEIEDEPPINPVTGVKLKVRATVVTADPNNAITYIVTRTKTNAVDQRLQYPLPRTELTITGFEPGSDIVVYDATMPADGSGTNVLATGDAVTGSFVFDYEGTPQIKIGVFKGGFVPQVTPTIILGTSNSTYTLQQRIDRNYGA